MVYLYVRPLFLYYFSRIASMTHAMLVNFQQILSIILLLCEVITPHGLSYNLLSFLFLRLKQQSKASNSNYSLNSHTWLHK